MHDSTIESFFDSATAHADHLSAAPYLKGKLGGKVAIDRQIREVQTVFRRIFNDQDMDTEGRDFDQLLDDGEVIRIGELQLHVMHTPGHTPAWVSSVGEQRAKNIHVHDGVSEAEFVSMRTERDKTLAMPLLILPAVQVNLRAGKLPTPEDNGVSYLKIPLNAL